VKIWILNWKQLKIVWLYYEIIILWNKEERSIIFKLIISYTYSFSYYIALGSNTIWNISYLQAKVQLKYKLKYKVIENKAPWIYYRVIWNNQLLRWMPLAISKSRSPSISDMTISKDIKNFCSCSDENSLIFLIFDMIDFHKSLSSLFRWHVFSHEDLFRVLLKY